MWVLPAAGVMQSSPEDFTSSRIYVAGFLLRIADAAGSPVT